MMVGRYGRSGWSWSEKDQARWEKLLDEFWAESLNELLAEEEEGVAVDVSAASWQEVDMSVAERPLVVVNKSRLKDLRQLEKIGR